MDHELDERPPPPSSSSSSDEADDDGNQDDQGDPPQQPPHPHEPEDTLSDDDDMAGGVEKWKIPIFTGDEEKGKELVTARMFILNIDSCRAIANPPWTNQQTIERAILHMQGSAGKWALNMRDDEADCIINPVVAAADADPNAVPPRPVAVRADRGNWAGFKDAFLAQFHVPPSATERMNLRLGCRQKAHEDVRMFYERVRADMRNALTDDHLAVQNNWNNDQRGIHRNWLNFQLDQQTKTYFLDGLRPDIRLEVARANPQTLEAMKTAAILAESTLKEATVRKKGHQVAATSTTTEAETDTASEDEMEIPEDISMRDFMTMFVKRKGFRGRRPPPRTGGAPSSGNRNSTAQHSGQKPRIKCYYCGKMGQHIARECNTKKADLKRGVNNPVVPYTQGPPNSAPAPTAAVSTYSDALNFLSS